MDYSLQGSSVHGIFQARVLEWVAISFSRGSSPPRDWTQVSHIARRHLYHLSHQGSSRSEYLQLKIKCNEMSEKMPHVQEGPVQVWRVWDGHWSWGCRTLDSKSWEDTGGGNQAGEGTKAGLAWGIWGAGTEWAAQNRVLWTVPCHLGLWVPGSRSADCRPCDIQNSGTVALRPRKSWAAAIPAACLQEFIPSKGIKFRTPGPPDAGFHLKQEEYIPQWLFSAPSCCQWGCLKCAH